MEDKHIKPTIEHEGKTYHYSHSTPDGKLYYLLAKDIETLKNHELTEEEVGNWFGEDGTDVYLMRITEIANGTYTVEEFRYDVLCYADLLSAPLIIYRG